ncbi:Pentatricopeptide repeat-containing protein [Nymphaea thermarum]|nr:Pentatricopeptide repeat-containing protein [Nymphaea thermarum]
MIRVIATVLNLRLNAPRLKIATFSGTLRLSAFFKSSIQFSFSCDASSLMLEKYGQLLDSCCTHKDLVRARLIHAHIVIQNFEQHSFLSSKLVFVYSACGKTTVARLVFDRLLKPSTFACNSMIRGYVNNGLNQEALDFFYQRREAGFRPDTYTYSSIIKACASLPDHEHGRNVHELVKESGLDADVYVCNALISMYSKFHCASEAVQIFDRMSERDMVSWNSVIACYIQNDLDEAAVVALKEMMKEGFRPDQVTIISILSDCSYATGRELHSYVLTSGFGSTVVIANSLISMYGKCGKLKEAQGIFGTLVQPDRVTWNALIASYSRNGQYEESLRLLRDMRTAGMHVDEVTYSGIISAFSQNDHPQDALRIFLQMLNAGLKPDAVAIASVLPALSDVQSLDCCKEIHGYSHRNSVESDKRVRNALVSVYSQCGSVKSAENVFSRISNKDVISWSSMIVGYTQNGCLNEAIKVFRNMCQSNTKPNPITITSILSACARVSSLKHGKEIHSWSLKQGFHVHTFVGSALIDMYAKCGRINSSRTVFNKMPEKNLVSWNVMIAGYAVHGQGGNALKLFKMVEHPDEVSFLAALSACSHGGLVEDGIDIFNEMKILKITPRQDHYACLVDILGRAGRLDEALAMIKDMPVESNINIWGALLGACRVYHNLELGIYSGKQMLESGCNDSGLHVLLSNIFADFGKWEDVETIRKSMKDRGLKKKVGCSWIGVDNQVHSFVARDRAHPEWEIVYQVSRDLNNQINEFTWPSHASS